jgi:hypothetical protein
MVLIREDLPEPLGPRMAIRSPASILRSMSLRINRASLDDGGPVHLDYRFGHEPLSTWRIFIPCQAPPYEMLGQRREKKGKDEGEVQVDFVMSRPA